VVLKPAQIRHGLQWLWCADQAAASTSAGA